MVAPQRLIPKLVELELVLLTPRLRLRPYTMDDVENLWPHVSDPALPREMSWNAHRDRSETKEFLERMIKERETDTSIVWAIERDGEFMGSIGLHGIRWQVAAWRIDRAELGYWLGFAFHNKGYMTEAARAVVRFGFDTLGLHKITVGCLSTNDASRNVIERLGAQFVGRQESDVWRDGAWHTHLRYEWITDRSA